MRRGAGISGCSESDFELRCVSSPTILRVVRANDVIWNRACAAAGATEIAQRQGDRSLAAMLQAHGLVMNGGPWDAIESCEANELLAAAAGYRYFGLEAAAQLIDRLVVASVQPPADKDQFEIE